MPERPTPLLTKTIFTRPSTQQIARLASRPLVRALLVAVVILALELVTFAGYFTGATAPQYDFFSHYNTEAWAWWRDGSFFHPVQWMPYAWGGYPGALDSQNSSFYLPVGLMTLFGPFTIHASAALSALHVGFGALGLFVLARSWKLSFSAAVLGLVAWFFVAGFYSNATQPDIMRAYAWLPWVLLVIGTSWRWNRWWRWPIAGLILWQAILAIYPGILVAAAYTCVVYIVISQIVFRPRVRAYLLPIAITGVAAVAMTLLRYLPLYLTRGASSPSAGDFSSFTQAMWGTFLYPYGDPSLVNDVTMQSFFIAATVVALVPFVPWSHRRARPLIGLLVSAALIGLPFWPWHDLFRSVLPGLGLSRFTMSDFKPFLLIALVLLAALAVDRITSGDAKTIWSALSLRLRFIVSGGIVTLFLLLGMVGPFDDRGWLTQFAFLVISFLMVGYLVVTRSAVRFLVGALVFVTAASGITAQLATTLPWVSDRNQVELDIFGGTVDSLIAQGDARAASEGNELQRPARVYTGDVVVDDYSLQPHWGRVFYTRELAVNSYVNIKGAPAFEQINHDLFFAARYVEGRAAGFWSAPGILIQRHGSRLPTRDETATCVDSHECGDDVTVAPVSYTTGRLVYSVTTTSAVHLAANEAYYPGWGVTACEKDDATSCRIVRSASSAHGAVTFTLPAGDWQVTMQYAQPGQKLAFVALGGGVLLLVLAAASVEVIRWRSRRRSSTAPATDTDVEAEQAVPGSSDADG